MDGDQPVAGQHARVNGALLSKFVGKTVLIMGELQSQNDGIATVLTSDNMSVNIQMQPGAFYTGPVVEILGRVQDGQTIEEMHCREFTGSQPFDMKNYDAMVEFMHGKYKEIFA